MPNQFNINGTYLYTHSLLYKYNALFSTKFSLIIIGLNSSHGVIVFIHGETLSAHSAHLQKIPGWIAVVREIFSVNQQAYRKETIETVLSGFLSDFFFNFAFDFNGFHLK